LISSARLKGSCLSLDSLSSPSKADARGSFFYKGGKAGCLLVHGFTGTPFVFRELGERLGRLGLTVSAPLLPGHGTSVQDLAHVRWSSWVETCRDEFERVRGLCEEIFILGLSMGGAIALILAAEKPCSGCVTLSAPVSLEARYRFLAASAGRVLGSWKKRHPVPFEMGYDRYSFSAVREYVRLLEAARGVLPSVGCPVLVVHSEKDRRVPLRNARTIVRKIGSSDKELWVLTSSGHTVIMGDEKERVNERIIRFFKTHSTHEQGTGTDS
jgi:carboxylesterase